MNNCVSTRKFLLCFCLILALSVLLLTLRDTSSMPLLRGTSFMARKDVVHLPPWKMQKMEFLNNTGALSYIKTYNDLFKPVNTSIPVPPDPHNPDSITTWWQGAAMLDWYISCPVRYQCKNRTAMGNWHICQDEPYKVKAPCLVYSFGINWDFSFDDAMAKLGCEVHSFDPSMKTKDHQRGNMITFHNMGLGSANTDGFIPRQDEYVKGGQVWKIRTVKEIMRQLRHENRVIDVFKMDIEGYEWGILNNMMETDVLKHIRQLILEFHLFYNFPLKEEYVYIYKTMTRFREMGFQEYAVNRHQRVLNFDKFRLQGDSEYINALFDKRAIQ